MGGHGSGGWYRWDKKDTAESYRSLDIRKLSREGWLRLGMAGQATWSRNGRKEASIGWAVFGSDNGKAESLELYYTVTPRGGEPKDVRYHVPITWTPCNYGGERPWFICPGIINGKPCSRRVAVLYGGYYFLCRHCHNLSYNSQREDMVSRLASKAQKIRERLGGHPGLAYPFPEKPKGMHWKTYVRRHWEAEDLEHESMLAMLKRFNLLPEMDRGKQG